MVEMKMTNIEKQDAPVSAFQALKTALQADPEYAWSWHCNLAMPIMDSIRCTSEQANKAGADLMQYLFDIDIRKHEHWKDHDGLLAASTASDKQEARDAERYRWMRRTFINDDESWPDDVAFATTGEKLDAAIDAELNAAPPAKSASDAQPIYQTCFIKDQWRDVDRAEYERAKGLRADLARIVCAAPRPAAQDAQSGEEKN
jgi:hypothetical protein